MVASRSRRKQRTRNLSRPRSGTSAPRSRSRPSARTPMPMERLLPTVKRRRPVVAMAATASLRKRSARRRGHPGRPCWIGERAKSRIDTVINIQHQRKKVQHQRKCWNLSCVFLVIDTIVVVVVVVVIFVIERVQASCQLLVPLARYKHRCSANRLGLDRGRGET